VDAEIEAYSQQIRSLLARVCACLEGLRESQLNWSPRLDGANSAYVIAAHTLGCARAWVLGIACGQPIGRDRATRELSAEMEAALAALPPAALERRLTPSQELWGEAEAYEISIREALIEVVEHASIHLGQLHVTCDLALREAPA
jgi:hypothetical protein